MKRKLLLACCALLLGWSNASAQTDVTATYISNPSFESDAKETITPTGWTISGTAGTKKVVDADSEIGDGYGIVTTLTDGTKGYGIRQAWAENTFSIYQSVTLPAGFYVLKVDEKSVYAAENSSKTPSFKLYAGGTQSENFAFTTQLANSTSFFPSPSYDFSTKSLSFYSDGSEVNIGVSISFMDKRNDVLLDNFKLYSYPAATSSDYSALKDALDAVGEKNCGFELGEYAPYTNKEAFEALAAAKAIDPSAPNMQSTVQAATTALTSATWTANDEEVNAIRWIFADYTDNVDKQVPIGFTNGDGDAIRVSANYGANTGLNQLNQKMCLNINTNDKAAIYGETAGYTLPLKGSTYYKLTFRYAGWGNSSGTPTIKILKEDDSELKSVTLDPSSVQGNNATGPWTSATILFQTTVAGNYKVSFGKSSNRTVFGDLELKKAVADEVTILENADYTPAASEYADVTLTRTIKADTWNTFVVPFAINNTDLKAAFGADVAVAEYSEDADGDNSTVSFTTMATPAVAANTPVLLKTSTAAGTSYTFPARTIVEGDAKVAGTNFDFVGNYNASLALVNGDYFISSNNLYKKGEGSTVTLKGTRAYIQPKSVGVKILNFVIDDEIVTGVDSVEDAEAEEDGVLYNTAGQQVTEDYKGIVIKNGKKYYQK